MRRPLAMVMVVCVAGLSACEGTEPSGPPAIRLGRDECAGCGMLVNEDRCSAGLLMVRDGRREHLVFDDLGCLLDYRAKHSDVDVVEGFVHDFASGRWLPASAASYLLGEPDRLPTPMGTGMVAFESQEAASRQRAASGGDIVNYDQMVVARSRWQEERRRAAGGG